MRKSWRWLEDTGRILGGLLFWNLRKSWFRIRRGRCPCQSPGDSGQAGRTRCEACATLNQPSRFQAVCPLLTRRDNQWVCSVDRSQIRPFWTRAFTTYTIIALIAYLGAATSFHSFLRYQGLDRLKWFDVIWPPRWSQIENAKATRFRQIASEAFTRSDFATALFAYGSAYQIDSSQWSEGLILARLHEHAGNYALAENLFRSLHERFPEQREVIALTHHDALLVTQRFGSLERLAWQQLLGADPNSAAWIHPVLRAVGWQSPDTRAWQSRNHQIMQLPPPLRNLLDLAGHANASNADDLAATIARVPMTDPLWARLRWELLLRNDYTDAAMECLLHDLDVLGDFESRLAHYVIRRAQGDYTSARQQLSRLLANQHLTENQLARLAGHLVTSADAEGALHVLRETTSTRLEEHAMLWIIAHRHGLADFSAELCRKMNITEDLLLPSGRETSLNRRHVNRLTMLLPLPREVIYALVERSLQLD